MRIVLDMDGVICKGPWIEPEQRTHETYQTIDPYDSDTTSILNNLCLDGHELYIITARKYKVPLACWSIRRWLSMNGFWGRLDGVITGIRASDKYHLAAMMHCDLIVDDSPVVWKCARTSGGPQMLLMNNPDWQENQELQDYVDGRGVGLPTYLRVSSWKELGERIASLNSRLISKS